MTDIVYILYIIGNVLIGVGIAFMIFGAWSLFKLKDFYPRILIASKIETVGILTVIIGFALRHGISWFTGKLLLILIIMLILNPLVAHITARSAYLSGYEVTETTKDELIGLEEEGEAQ